jgi:hypothetical protein
MNGVPFDVAFGASAAMRLAMVVGIGTLKGGRFDWEAMAWT